MADDNKRINKSISKKENDIRGWKIFKAEAHKAGDKELVKVFDQRIKEAEAAILALKKKLK